MIILNPKREAHEPSRAAWYPYYAGYSVRFAEAVIRSASLPSHATILDPWNGSGTTTVASTAMGYHAMGFDLNPVTVIVAKARLLAARERPSLTPLATSILAKARKCRDFAPTDGGDPLEMWLTPRSAFAVRSIEHAVQRILIDDTETVPLHQRPMAGVSGIAAFFYLALFRLLRTLVRGFSTTNPTWIRIPATPLCRRRPTRDQVFNLFRHEVRTMADTMSAFPGNSADSGVAVTLDVGDSRCLPLRDSSVDFVLASPPYCTRIDYAVSTLPEASVLGISSASHRKLRESLMGTTAVATNKPSSPDMPESVQLLLDRIASHPSKGSHNYYFPTLASYFDCLGASLHELNRVMRPQSTCMLVVQDSYYKNVHIDLPSLLQDMATAMTNWTCTQRTDFHSRRTMGKRNPRLRKRRRSAVTTESAICFVRP